METGNNSATQSAQNEDSLTKTTKETEQEHSLIKTVRAPRKLVWEIPLMIFTFSSYLPFWAVGRARDLKAASGNSYTPWLWFFTPLFWIAGVIAYDSMFKELQIHEAKKQSKQWARWTVPWILVFIVTSVFFNVQHIIQTSVFIQLVVLALFCLLFALLHRRFNQWKVQDARLTFKGKSKGYAWYEWLVLIFSVPLYAFTAYESTRNVIRTFNMPVYNDQQEVLVKDLRFKFTIHGDKWVKVRSTEADFEMLGPGDESSVFVYSYTNDQTLDGITSSRFDLTEAVYQGLKCSETIEFEVDRQGTRSVMECNGTYWGSPVHLISVVIGLDNQLMEFVGVTSSSTRTFTEKISQQIDSMASSFRLLPEENDE